MPGSEEVVLDLHPHGRALIRPLGLVPVIVGLAAFAAAATPPWVLAGARLQGWLRLAVAVLGALALARWSLAPYLRWRARRYLLTTGTVSLREGVLRRRSQAVPLDRICDVGYEAGLVDRLFRSGTLVVDGGGEHGRLRLTAVPRVARVARTLNDLVRRTESVPPPRR